MKTYQSSVLAEAQKYIDAGWHVFPVHGIGDDGVCSCGNARCSDKGKHPACSRGLKEASTDVKKIKEWFSGAKVVRNIAVVTGELSGITVLDIDIGEGKLGDVTWAELTKEHGEPQTLMAKTGGGGMHVLFKYNSALKTASNVLGKGVDCRNDGGYIVVPPSRHRSGTPYQWINWGTALCSLPAHLSRRKETRGRPRKDDMYRSRYTIEQVRTMMGFVPADDRDMWRHVGVILGREFKRDDAAWQLYMQWAAKWSGKQGRNHDEIMREAFYEISQDTTVEKQLSLGTIVKLAIDNGWAPKAGEVPINHFVFYGPGNNYIYRPTVSYWVGAAVDAAVSPLNQDGNIIKASEWLRANQLVTSMTADPKIEDDYVKGMDCHNGEIAVVPGAALFNAYRRPTIELGDARLAGPFVEHVRKMLNKDGDAEQFLNYMAHRVQRPWEKPRFALLIAGAQGVGKDTAVEFCCPAIGVWNVANIDPSAFDSAFNEFAATTLVRISEAANLHEMTRWAFNERTKVLIAGSPDTCTINPKYGQKFSVRMYCGVIITTNHLASGIYIPSDDRRYDVMEAATMDEMKIADERTRRQYFSDLWDWFLHGGATHVAAWLHARDISRFSANNGQRKTAAHSAVVAGSATTDHWLGDILHELQDPQLVRADWIITKALANGENGTDVRRKLVNTLVRLDYVLYKNPNTRDGRWLIGDKLQMVFAKAGTPMGQDVAAALNKEIF